MKSRDLANIFTVAVGTAAAVVVTFSGNSLEAGRDGTELRSVITTPELLANGIKISLATRKGNEPKAGVPAEFDMNVVNTREVASEATVRLVMSASAPANPLSRIMIMPTQLWSEERTLTLGPKETKRIPVVAHTNLPTGREITVRVISMKPANSATTPEAVAPQLANVPENSIVALRFSTVPAPPQVAQAVATTTKP